MYTLNISQMCPSYLSKAYKKDYAAVIELMHISLISLKLFKLLWVGGTKLCDKSHNKLTVS